MNTADFEWQPVNQSRCGVLVDSVLSLFAANPIDVVNMDLREWKLEEKVVVPQLCIAAGSVSASIDTNCPKRWRVPYQ
jgi:hypothetical protein